MPTLYRTTLLLSSIFFALTGKAQLYCNDPEAYNYLPSATTSDNCIYITECPEGLDWFSIVFDIDTDCSYAHHITTFDFSDTLYTIAFDEGPFITSVCLSADECYQLLLDTTILDQSAPNHPSFFNIYEASSTFHNNGSLQTSDHWLISPAVNNDNDTSRIFRLNENDPVCNIIGCMDPESPNYNPEALIAGECEECNENLIRIDYEQLNGTLYDSFSITSTTEPGLVFTESDYEYEGYNSKVLCLPDGCYQFNISGNAWFFNRVHAIDVATGDTLVSGTHSHDSTTIPFAVNTTTDCEANAAYGCTLESAANYDPNAEVNDGSCVMTNNTCSVEIEAEFNDSNGLLSVTLGGYSTYYPWFFVIRNEAGDVLANDLWTSFTISTDELGIFCVEVYAVNYFDTFDPYQACADSDCFAINADSLGFSGDSIQVELINQINSLVENTGVKPLKIHPNPASEVLYVNLPADLASTFEVSIYDLSGKRIYSPGELSRAEILELPVSQLAKGMYIVELNSSGRKWSGMFLKGD